MKCAYLIAGGMVIAFAAPALAVTTYYIAQNTRTIECSVVTKMPDGGKFVQVGPDSYRTKPEAEAALKTAPECETQNQ
jgi:hypothetical protein